MADGDGDAPPRGGGMLRFSPTIELGHLVQAIVMLGALGGWALVGYQTITKQLDQHAAEMALFKQRLTTEEMALTEVREGLRSAITDTGRRLDKISDQIGDLRTLVASQAAGRDNGPRR